MPPAVRTGSWRDPVLITLAVSTVIVVGGFLLDVGTPRTQMIAGGIATPVLDFALFWLSRQVCRVPGLPSHARRFWAAVGVGGLLFSAGDLVQLGVILTDPGVQRILFHPVQSASMMLGVVVMMVGLLLPQRVASRSGREQTRLLLDAAILMSASAVVAWCLMTRPGMAGAGPGAFFLALFGCGVVLCAIFAAVRSGLTGVAPMSRVAAVPMVIAPIGLAVTSVLLPSGGVQNTGVQMAAVLVPCFLVLAGPRLQVLHGTDGLDGREWFHRRRRFSVLPYTGTLVCAVALVYVLTSRGLGVSAWGALAGLLCNVGLVIARQVLSLTENDLLVGEIRHREKRLTSLLEHSSEIISIADVDGGFTYVSPAVERVLGFAVADVLGQSSLEILHRDDRARLAGDLARLYTTPGDVPARLGGDEFAVLTGGDRPPADRIAERLRAAFASPAVVDGRELTVGASIGLATGPAGGGDHLLNSADLLMYEEKQRSRTLTS